MVLLVNLNNNSNKFKKSIFLLSSSDRKINIVNVTKGPVMNIEAFNQLCYRILIENTK